MKAEENVPAGKQSPTDAEIVPKRDVGVSATTNVLRQAKKDAKCVKLRNNKYYSFASNLA